MSESVLVVDDERIMVEIVTEFITSISAADKIDQCSNGKDALKMCLTQKYKLILLDYMMASMNGGEFVISLRRGSSINKETPIIFVTANEEQAKPYTENFSNVIMINKPIHLKKFTDALNFFFKK